ncbi:PIN domain-containing protein [Bifidobacterium longum]|uniref:PIN domain-containing protein n=1 Tax=Bifidobacterium longum TaxID=216816 RepID=UPI001F58755F|nr:PIN domain-containing protein [Bifidobacterium longum]
MTDVSMQRILLDTNVLLDYLLHRDDHAKMAVVPEFLRTLVFARPRGDDQFADCTFSPSLDMSILLTHECNTFLS